MEFLIMKHFVNSMKQGLILVCATLLLSLGCTREQDVLDESGRKVTVHLSFGQPDTRVSLHAVDQSLDMFTSWQRDDKIIAVLYNGQYWQLDPVNVKNIMADGKSCTFQYELPKDFNIPEAGYRIWLFTEACAPKVKNSELSYGASLIREPISSFRAPVMFTGVVNKNQEPYAEFSHYGTYEILHVSNDSDTPVRFAMSGYSADGGLWYKTRGNIMAADGSFVADTESGGVEVSNEITIPAGFSDMFVSWYIPTGNKLSDAKFTAKINGEFCSTSNRKSSDAVLRTGHAYHLYVTWNGTELTYRQPQPQDLPTEPTAGEMIDLGLSVAWASHNVGATKPQEVGGFYAWGETGTKSSYDWSNYALADGSANLLKKYCTQSSYGTVDNIMTLEPSDDAAYAASQGRMRMPTAAEWQDLKDCCVWTKMKYEGQDGYLVASPITGNAIFIPCNGFRTGTNYYNFYAPYYWTADLSADSSPNALSFGYINQWKIDQHIRFEGLGIRPVSDGWDESTIEVDPTFLDFGKVAIGTSVTKTVTVTNTGSGNLTFYLVGGNEWFTYTPEEETTLAPGESCEVSVTFRPQSASQMGVVLRVFSNATNGTKFVECEGEGVESTVSGAVDLGLPSGVMWASKNLGAESELGTGGYYAWGEIETKADYSWDTYAFGKPGTEEGMIKYNQDGLSDLLPDDDIIHQMYGGNWRIPTITEWEELRQECTWEEIRENDIRIGYKITSKHNGAVLYLPACGQMDGMQVTRNDVAKYWSSSRGGSSDWSTNPQKARALFESSYGYYYRSGGDDRFLGQQIRGVLVPSPEFTPGDLVDMGLSVKWSSFNLGAPARGELGPYYAWGALEPTDSYTWDTYRFGTLETGMTKYNSSDALEYLDREDDIVWQTLGGNWRTPTMAEWDELKEKCEWTQCYVNGRLGYRIVSSVNGNSIYLPFCGHMDGTRMGDGMRARYWASSRGGTSDWSTNPQKARALNEHSYGWNYRSPGDDRYLGLQLRPVFDDSFDESMLTEGEMIDMGQGVLWARCNFGSDRPEEVGGYYAWGELTPKESYSWENYKFSSDGTQGGIFKYNATDGLTILTGADDVVHKVLGDRWRMPTRGELADLWDNSERVMVNFNGRRGLLLTSKINGNKLFLPIGGYINGTQLSSGMVAKYWSSDRGGSSDYNTYPQKARALNESSYGYNYRSPGDDRCLGMLIRAVYDPYVDDLTEGELVDMGLSVKWASRNLSVDQPEDVGAYYAWGETETKTDFTWDTYKFSENGAAGNHTKYNDTDAIMYLDWEDDVVHKTLEGAWRMPTRTEWQELIDNCDWTEMTRNGVRGFRIQSRITENVIFLPSGGYYDGDGLRDGMRPRYWSNERGPTDEVSNRARALNESRYGYNYRRDGDERRMGMPVRGVYDDSVEQTLTPGDFVDMGLSVEWASCNIGTLSPEGYGRYYGWGEISVHSENTWATYAFSSDENGTQMTKYNADDNKVTLELIDDAAFMFSSATQRMPKISEWEELMENTTQVTKIMNGHLGLLLTSKINGNSLFLPLAGYRDGKQVVSSSRPHYWSADRGGTSDYNNYPQKARALGEGSYGFNYRSPGDNRYFGMPIRGVKK